MKRIIFATLFLIAGTVGIAHAYGVIDNCERESKEPKGSELA